MPNITRSVGLNGSNQQSDVEIIQQLLNQNRHLLMPISALLEDGQIDESNNNDPTIVAIKTFQNRVVLPTLNSLPNPSNFPDGLIEPGKNTIAKLNQNAKNGLPATISLPLFPLKQRPTASYKQNGRYFGASRGSRLHAACDLLQPPGTEVRAMENGVVATDPMPFFAGTVDLGIDHGNFVTRYSELSRTARGIIKGVSVTKGQVIGWVGRLTTTGASMLHLEMYSGTETGSLTVRRNLPYQRRSDLLNPTDYLDIATLDITTPLLLNETAMGRVNTRVITILNLRKEADTSSDSLAELTPGTTFTILQQVTGANYDGNGTNRNDWYKVEFEGKQGFVAVFFVDLEWQTGRVNSQVQTQLNLREAPVISAPVIAGLAPGTTIRILDRVIGSNYHADGTTRNDWYEVEYSGQTGFVAVFFIALVETIEGNNPNAILFTYEPQGASDRTASQDNLPQQGIRGVEASQTMAETDRSRVMRNKETFKKAGQDFNLPPALLAAIASRESRGGNILDRNGWGDRGNAFGIMQVDKRFHRVMIEGGSSGEPHIEQATEILKSKLEEVERQFSSLSDSAQLQTAVSRYNGGLRLAAPNSDEGTTGADYMNDVWARGRYYATVEDWT